MEPPLGSKIPNVNELLGNTRSDRRESSESTALPCVRPHIVNSTFRPPGSACGNTWAYPFAPPSGLVSDSTAPPPAVP